LNLKFFKSPTNEKRVEKTEKKVEKKEGSASTGDLFALKITGAASAKEKKPDPPKEESRSPTIPKLLSLRASKPAVPSAEKEKIVREKHGPLISPRKK